MLGACYSPPAIEGFSSDKWENALTECDGYRISGADSILKNKEQLLLKNQNEIRELLGAPARHQLFSRNQKFFFYELDCKKTTELSIRFDALGRVKELQVLRTQ